MNSTKLISCFFVLYFAFGGLIEAKAKNIERTKFNTKLQNKKENKNPANRLLNESKDESLFKFTSSHKLIHSSDEVDIYQSEAIIENSLLDDYFKIYKLEFQNKTAHPIIFEGEVFNKISAEEARAKITQHQNIRKRKKRRIKLIGYAGLITTSVVGGLYAPSLVLYRFLQKTLATTIVSRRLSKKNKQEQINSFKVINDFIDSERAKQEFTINSGKSYALWYVLPISPNTNPIILFKSKSTNNPNANLFFYSQDLSDGEIKQLSNKNHDEIIKYAFVDGELLDGIRAGIYSNEKNNLTQLKYTKNGFHDYERNSNSFVRINGLEATNVLKSSQLKLIVQQNIYKRPTRYQITLLKLRINKENACRESNGDLIQFALKETKPGLLELRSPKRSKLNLDRGDYAIIIKNGSEETKVFDFQLI